MPKTLQVTFSDDNENDFDDKPICEDKGTWLHF